MPRTLTLLPAAFLLCSAVDTAKTPAPDSSATPPAAARASDTTTVATLPPNTVDVVVRADSARHAISPYIYGSNQDDIAVPWTVRRWGGNRMTGYNWETNASNAGVDYLHQNDLYLIANPGLSEGEARTPARAATYFHDQSLDLGAASVITLQVAGFAAADASGPVSEGDKAPSKRWVRVEARKPTPLADTPDTKDGVVYMDEFVRFLVRKYGPASSSRGIKFYSLDNEPALWPSTHPRLHPQKTGAAELVERSIAVAAAAKSVDSTAEILGPAAYGMAELLSMQFAPDFKMGTNGDDWYVDYYLKRMRAAEKTAGRRLLDVFDVHWYPEAKGDHRIGGNDATTLKDIAARLQAPRTLWDSTYREDSWVAQNWAAFLPLLPRLKRSIAANYPGTKLGMTEYNYGSGNTIDGGVAQADVLGVFGREGVEVATRWQLMPQERYVQTAFKLFLNYDGKDHNFGDTSVLARASDNARLSAYASIDGGDASRLHVILINKDLRDTVTARVRLGGGTWAGGEAWGFGLESGPRVAKRPAPTVAGGVLTYALPPLSATHVVLR